MTEISELRRVPAFADLPEDQLSWFISQAQELNFKAGDTYSRQGDPADAMFVVLTGQLELRGEFGGQSIVIPVDSGEITF